MTLWEFLKGDSSAPDNINFKIKPFSCIFTSYEFDDTVKEVLQEGRGYPPPVFPDLKE